MRVAGHIDPGLRMRGQHLSKGPRITTKCGEGTRLLDSVNCLLTLYYHVSS
jgi:hypothetical protein